MNARFWTYQNGGWVKITLRPGQSLTYAYGANTDEGWHRSAETWTHDGESVHFEWAEESRDCDGRFDSAGESACALDYLQFIDSEAGIKLPAWQHVDSCQRDYSAEAMGY